MKKVITLLIMCSCARVFALSEQAYRLVIPAAAHAAGADESFWTTDLSVHNPSHEDAFLRVTILPSGREGFAGTEEYIEYADPLGPGQTLDIPDVLGSFFSNHQTGALLLTSRDANGAPVPIAASSRTWTPSPSLEGSYGQGIPAVAWRENGDLGAQLRILTGLAESDAVRTNLGLVNPSSESTVTVGVELFDSTGSSQGSRFYTLGPGAHFQRNRILNDFGLEGTGFAALVSILEADGPDPDLVAYASRIDRLSNDPSLITEQIPENRWGSYQDRVVPVVAHLPGVNDSLWRTDLSLRFPDDQAWGFVNLELVPDAAWTGDPPDRVTLTMTAGQNLLIEDVLAEHFPDFESGALHISAIGITGGRLNLQVDSRTWTPAPDGAGSLGQGIPGESLAPGDDPVAIVGLVSDLEFRSNLGIVNLSHNLRETFDIEVFDTNGDSRGHLIEVLEPWTATQINGILDNLGLEGGGYSAVISLVEHENLMLEPSESWDPFFMAYGSRVDQVTNDPTYLAAISLAQAAVATGDWFDFAANSPWYLCPDEDIPEEATVISTFNQAYHWFGAENHREIIEEVEFPTDTRWNQIGLRLRLECPENGLCDHWDRTGSLQLVLNPEDPQEDWDYLEIVRHITPYRIGMCEYVDITALAPLLQGSQTLVSWIDTWVGPGHSDGEGWRISFDFVFYPGEDQTPDQVINVWGRRNLTLGDPDPDHNVDAQIDPFEFELPSDTERVLVRLVSTGHSFGNTDNCAEFCPLRQDIFINGTLNSVLPWRTDCEYNPYSNQAGTWRYDRNGWCPGAIVVGDMVDITNQIDLAEPNTLDFDVVKQDGSEYINNDPGGATPLEWISMQIFVYR